MRKHGIIILSIEYYCLPIVLSKNKITVSLSAHYTQCLCVLMINIPLGIHACEDVDQWLCEKPNLISLLMNLYL